MHNDVDYNGFRILNLGQLNVTSLVVNGISVDAAIAETAANAAAAAASAANANSSAVSASNSAASAAATLAGSLLKANNLSDVNNVATSRSNLGLGTAAVQDIGTSGATIPLLSTTNTWTLGQTYSSSTIHSTGLAVDNTVASATRNITYRTSGSLRWNLSTDAIAEGGSNAGSNFNISRYNDAGTPIDTPFFIARSTGVVTFTQKPVIPALSKFKATTVAATSLTNNVFTAPITYTAAQNVGSNFVASTGVYTAPVAGEYTFWAGARCTAAAIGSGTQFIIGFFVNGSVVRQMGTTFAATATAAMQVGASASLTLAANDLVTMRIFQNSGGALTIDAGGTTFFDGRLELIA
jgi:hypothetical protein